MTVLNNAFEVDVRLINNRKEIALTSIKNQKLSAYEERTAIIKLNWKVEVILEALEGLNKYGIANNYPLVKLWNELS